MSEVVPPINFAQEQEPEIVESIDSDAGEQGGDTRSSMNASMAESHNELENSQNIGGDSDSNAPLSSRGSTKATGEDIDAISFYNRRPYVGRDMWQDHG